MPGDETSGADRGPLSEMPASAGKDLPEQRTSSAPVAGDTVGLRVVSAGVREQTARQLAASLTGAVAEFLLDTEKQALNRAESVRASVLDDLERQRASVEKLIGMFADRLQQQEAGFSSLQQELEGVMARLDRHTEAIRYLDEAQARHVALLSQLLDVFRLLVETAKSAAPPPRNSV